MEAVKEEEMLVEPLVSIIEKATFYASLDILFIEILCCMCEKKKASNVDFVS